GRKGEYQSVFDDLRKEGYVRVSLNSINNLLHRLHSNLSSTLGAMGMTHPGIK
ncbi:unnamed protein product, partial [marine sediment metagenome]